jgi:nicotinate-nucleotide adenylyltransferase
MKAKLTALYGGAFDPFHNGHLAIIASLLNSGTVQDVLVVPSGNRPDKRVQASGKDRLAMARMAIEDSFLGDPRVSVSDLHVTGQVGFGTIDLLDHYQLQGNVELIVVIGQELLKDLPQWKESERLKRDAKFLVIHRSGTAVESLPAGWQMQQFIPPYQDGVLVSSSSLRELLSRGSSCAGLMPANVIRYCCERGLYR